MDKKAKNILLQTYWCAGGWTDTPKTSPDDFLYAKEKGLMFDPITISHDECVTRVVELANAITKEEVARAFLSSLSTRRLELRSGIASWYLAKLFSPHIYTPVVSGHSYENGIVTHASYTCGICKDVKYGVIGNEFYRNEDLNVLNFERIKWGGVRHGDLLYTMFDLEQFQREDISEPLDADIEIFKNILSVIENSQTGDYPSILRKRLADVPLWKSNQSERHTLIEILSCMGILQPGSYDRPIANRNDWTYAEFWRGEDKYNKAAVKKLFGNL